MVDEEEKGEEGVPSRLRKEMGDLVVDELGFFLAWVFEASSLVSREKEKLEPTVNEKVKDLC